MSDASSVSSSADSVNSDSDGRPRRWHCFLGCGQRYMKSSGRSIRRHVLACYRKQFASECKGVSDAQIHELLVSQEEKGIIHTGLKRWRLRRGRRLAMDLPPHERWDCPNQCGRYFRSTSSRSIAKHKSACRADERKEHDAHAQPHHTAASQSSHSSTSTQSSFVAAMTSLTTSSSASSSSSPLSSSSHSSLLPSTSASSSTSLSSSSLSSASFSSPSSFSSHPPFVALASLPQLSSNIASNASLPTPSQPQFSTPLVSTVLPTDSWSIDRLNNALRLSESMVAHAAALHAAVSASASASPSTAASAAAAAAASAAATPSITAAPSAAVASVIRPIPRLPAPPPPPASSAATTLPAITPPLDTRMPPPLSKPLLLPPTATINGFSALLSQPAPSAFRPLYASSLLSPFSSIASLSSLSAYPSVSLPSTLFDLTQLQALTQLGQGYVLRQFPAQQQVQLPLISWPQ